MKYLFKYINKQSDKVWFKVNANDEIRAYQDARCIGATEAFWHLLSYPIVWCSHKILGLPVHLPGMQFVFYEEKYVSKRSMSRLFQRNTPLMAWLEVNKAELRDMANGVEV
jgi:hypothetical protein